MYENLFAPTRLGALAIKNKIARSATFSFMENKDGYLTDTEIGIYETLAKHDVGLLFTGMFCVSENGIFDYDGPLVTDDRYLPRLQLLAQAVHRHGAKIVPQINQVGARATKTMDVPLAPSAIEITKGRMTRALSMEEIKQIAEDFAKAAYRVQQAGFDGVQIHAAHGYLVTQFLSPLMNLREDEYGGSIENRFRLLREIIVAVRQACKDDFPVFVKINSNSEQDEVYEQELLYMLREMKDLGVTAVELSGYNWRFQTIQDHNYYMERAARMRELAAIPIILVGGIRSLADMKQVLEQGIDMVSLARPLISEPELLTKLQIEDRNARCISCNQCFVLPASEGRRCILHQTI